MRRMKSKAFLYLFVFLFAANAFSSGSIVDFDGKKRDAKTIGILIGENTQTLPPVPVNEVDSGFVLKREMLTEAGDWVEFKPIRTWIESGVKYNQYTVKPGSAARWALRCNSGKWTAKEEYSFWNDEFGGHYHFDPPPPGLAASSVTLSISTPPVTAYQQTPSPIYFPEMQGNTTYYYWEAFPSFAAKIQEQFTAYGACQYSAVGYVDVKISGLVEMTEGQNYILYNSDESIGYHPDNHYGAQKLVETLKIIADGYRAVFPNSAPIQINDMSLPWGGIFDIDRDWKRSPASTYWLHEQGYGADISKTNIPLENRQKLLEIMCKNSAVYSEQATSREVANFHVQVSNKTPGLISYDVIADERTVTQCCKGNEVDPATLQICVATQTSTSR